MKYCIVVQEVLRKEVVVEAESLEEAFEIVEDAYDSEQVILGGDDLLAGSMECVNSIWHSKEDVENMEVTFKKREVKDYGVKKQ